MSKRNNIDCGDSMLHEIDKNRLPGAKTNTVKVKIFRGVTIDDMKNFLKPHLERSPTKRTLPCMLV